MASTEEKEIQTPNNVELTPKRDPYQMYAYVGEYAEEAYLDERQRTRDAR